MLDLSPLERWRPSPTARTITTVDAHTGGEPFRVVVSGIGPLRGSTILERRRDARSRLDHLRTSIMWEPRGHADMYGCLLTEPVTDGADVGVLFIHNEGYSSMCGHGIIALVTVLHETGCLGGDGNRVVRIDTPAGLVTATAHRTGGRLDHVSFENVPSFVQTRGGVVHLPGYGPVRYDLAFGGAFYAYVDARALDLELAPSSFRSLIECGMAIKHAVAAADPPVHPFEPDLSFLYGTIFTSPFPTEGVDSRHVCIFADGEVDRSPTGTGVSARVALFHFSGDMPVDRGVVIDSIVGSRFTGEAVLETTFGRHAAVIPSVSGTAHVCGWNQWVLDPGDPYVDGFFLR